MAIYITFGNFTEQGIKNVKESPDRAEAFRDIAKKHGVTLKDIYWTVGQYDIVAVFEGPEEAVSSLLLKLGGIGNVRTQSMQAFTADQMRRIISNIP